jgi:aarF domain-containing kinase
MINHGFQPREVVVPKPIPGMTTPRMLVMELLPGPKLIDGIREYLGMWAAQNGTTLHNLEKEAREKIEKEGIPGKYNGPSAVKISLYRKYVRIRDTSFNIAIAAYNRTAGWVAQPINYKYTSIPPNVPRMIDTLMRVHGNQLLRDGVFNSGE